MTAKSEKLAEKIAALQEQMRAAEKAEREADEAELLRLIERADCLLEALEWARAKAGRRKHTKQNRQECSDERDDK